MITEYVIHEHKAKRAGKHYDFRIKYPNKRMLISFAIPKASFPTDSKRKVLVVQTSDHKMKWLKWTKPIESGYGAGTFEIVQKGKIEIEKWDSDKIIFNIEGLVATGRFTLIKFSNPSNQQTWLLIKIKDKKITAENYLMDVFDKLEKDK